MAQSDFVLRVMSPLHGTKRIDVNQRYNVDDFLHKVKNAFDLPKNGWKVYMNREKTLELSSEQSKPLSAFKLKHGDMVYLDVKHGSLLSTVASENPSMPRIPSSVTAGALLTSDSTEAAKALDRDCAGGIIEDDVDQFLWKQDGKIARERNEQLCRHGPVGKCFHCVPYEPYDEEYLAKVNPPIKFLSFHSHLRKLTGGADRGKFAMMENLSCKIKPGCKEHPPWPGGICTKCQPNAVTLMRQKYRHVDYVQFENPQLVERFLDYWRKTGEQRMGYLYGRYEHHKDMPLGIKAVVTAIYEPLQVGSKTSIEMVEDEDEVVNRITARLHLRKVGWMFTDLVPLQSGLVKHCRGDINSHFLSAEECIMAADLQNRHPNPCKLASDGHFGSKFVTVVVTGDSTNQIHFEGYQVSNQCMALVRDDCLVPTKDAPELGYIKESTNEQYVPDVFYKVTDGYGNEVTQLARPLPVEYLLLDLPAAFPVEPTFTFYASAEVKPFPIAHRDSMGEIQDFSAFCAYMRQFSRERYSLALNDLHLLVYIATCDMLPLKDELDSLLDALYSKDESRLHGWFKSEAWATVEQLMDAHGSSPDYSTSAFSSSLTQADGGRGGNAGRKGGAGGGSGAGEKWTCRHCTFINSAAHQTCDICALPRD